MSLFSYLSGARFSPCKNYRYTLWRAWADRPHAMFLMLNPSTADEIDNDPTVERCQRRAAMMGYGGLHVANIFAYRSTDPAALYSVHDPVGPENDKAIMDAALNAGIVICAWGTHGKHMNRGEQVLALLRNAGVKPYCLQINADGTPKHPLYVGYEVSPKPMLEPENR